MKLYILEPKENLPENNPWKPWYDRCFAEVVRAENVKEARKLASEEFSDSKFSTCKELKVEGKSKSIIRDCHWA